MLFRNCLFFTKIQAPVSYPSSYMLHSRLRSKLPFRLTQIYAPGISELPRLAASFLLLVTSNRGVRSSQNVGKLAVERLARRHLPRHSFHVSS